MSNFLKLCLYDENCFLYQFKGEQGQQNGAENGGNPGQCQAIRQHK